MIVLGAIDSIRIGAFTEAKLNAVKLNLLMQFEAKWESNEERVYEMATYFSSNKSWEKAIEYKNNLKKLNKKDILKLHRAIYGKII